MIVSLIIIYLCSLNSFHNSQMQLLSRLRPLNFGRSFLYESNILCKNGLKDVKNQIDNKQICTAYYE